MFRLTAYRNGLISFPFFAGNPCRCQCNSRRKRNEPRQIGMERAVSAQAFRQEKDSPAGKNETGAGHDEAAPRLFFADECPGGSGSGSGDGDGAAAPGAAERGTGSGGEASAIPEIASPAAASTAPAAASAPALQWESDRPATDTEERVYRLACLYLGNAVADGGKIRFPAFGAPGTSIRKAEKGYEVAGFFRIEGKDGRFVDYRYTLTVDEHIVSVLNSSTTRMEAKP